MQITDEIKELYEFAKLKKILSKHNLLDKDLENKIDKIKKDKMGGDGVDDKTQLFITADLKKEK